MARVQVSLKMDAGVLARVDARCTGSRSMWVERAVRAFLAHDEGSANELATVVRAYLEQGSGGDLDAKATDALTRFVARSRC